MTARHAPRRPMVVIEGLVKTFDRGRVVAVDGVDLTVAHRRRHRPRRTVGLGQEHRAALHQRAELPTAGTRGRRRPAPHRRSRATSTRSARRSGMVFQQFNLFAHLTALENITLAQRDRPQAHEGRGRVDRARAARARRHPREGRQLSPRAQRRPAATRRDRAVARDGPEADALRRADERARPRDDQRGARRDARARQGRHDDGGGHPRDGLRRGPRPTRS